MPKLFKDMTDEEKEKVYARTERYRKKNMTLYASAALKYYYGNKEKCAEKAKNWRLNNKEYVRQKQREYKLKNKIKAIELLGGICVDCGNIYPEAVYEFHHTDPSNKGAKDPSKFLSNKWTKIEDEISKCVLLCANCHRIRHHYPEEIAIDS